MRWICSTRVNLKWFCLVTSDSDFTGLAMRLREEGLTVLGFGEHKTPEAFRSACHKFLFTEVLRPTATMTPATESPKVGDVQSRLVSAPPAEAKIIEFPKRFVLEALGRQSG